MHVIEVVPLVKNSFVDTLSYYSSVAYPVGTLLRVPVRKKTALALVISVAPVSLAKTALRTATFSLRKLEPQSEYQTLPSPLTQAATELTRHYPTSVGTLLAALLPPDVLSGTLTYPSLREAPAANQPEVPSVLTGLTPDRYSAYRGYVREAFAHRGSVVLVVPTAAEALRATAALSQGIEKRVVALHGNQTPKVRREAFATFADVRQAKLAIVTPSYAFLYRPDLTHLIIEHVGSQQYVSRNRPYLDYRQALRCYARAAGLSVLYGDAVPPSELEYHRREDRYLTHHEHPIRYRFTHTYTEAKHESTPNEFSLATPTLEEAIKRNLANRHNVLLFSSRRGLAPIVLCNDCGHIFRCPDSGAPFSLLRTQKNGEEERWFYCGTSGKRVRAADICPDCGSWRLREQGIGVQQVYDYAKTTYPNAPLFLLDHTTATTPRKTRKICEAFYAEKGAILVGTSLTLAQLTEPVGCVGVISYEAMRAMPTWRADETVFGQIIQLRELANNDFVLQTRSNADDFLNILKKGALDDFYDGELAVRKMLAFPPFTTFVLLSIQGSVDQVSTTTEMVKQHLGSFTAQWYQSPLSTKDAVLGHGLIRVAETGGIPEELLVRLRTLPPYVKVEINPARIV